MLFACLALLTPALDELLKILGRGRFWWALLRHRHEDQTSPFKSVCNETGHKFNMIALVASKVFHGMRTKKSLFLLRLVNIHVIEKREIKPQLVLEAQVLKEEGLCEH